MPEKLQIIPYSTPDGIISLVPWENYEQLKRQLDNAIAVSRDRLLAAQNAEAESEQLREEIERLANNKPPVVDGMMPGRLAGFEDIAMKLCSIGWTAQNDAQWEGLRDALPELRAMLGLAAFGPPILEAAIARMEAVPDEELRELYFSGPGTVFDRVRARLIAASRDGQPAYAGYMTDELPALGTPVNEIIAAIQPEPATFQRHGKTWITHVPGDPMPCDKSAAVTVLYAPDEPYQGEGCPADCFNWKNTSGYTPIIGWRYTNELSVTPTVADCGQCADTDSEFESFERGANGVQTY